MTWTSFFLFCFLFGFFLSLLSFLAGALRIHIPVRARMCGGHGPAAGGHAAAPPARVGLRGAGAGARPVTLQVSPYNAMSLTAFICWFGAAGYLLSRSGGRVTAWIIAAAVLCGFLGGAVVFWFLAKVLMKEDHSLDPAEYDMAGVIGHLGVGIRAGGTGELIYEQAGTRRVIGARAESGEVIPKDEEVVVFRCERGLAYVKRWADLAGERGADEEQAAGRQS